MDSKTGFYITQSKHPLEHSKYFDDESNNEDAEPSRRRAKREHQVEKPAAVIFTARSGRQWTSEESAEKSISSQYFATTKWYRTSSRVYTDYKRSISASDNSRNGSYFGERN